MKSNNSLVLLIAIIGFSVTTCSNSESKVLSEPQKSNKTQIKIKVEGAGAGTVKLGGYYGSQQYLVDTFTMDAKGTVEITKADTVYPWGYYVIILPDQQSFIQLLLGPDQEFSVEAKISDINGSMVIKGDINNELYYENIKWESAYQNRFSPVNAELEGLEEESDAWKKAREKQKSLINERNEHVKTVTGKAPNSVFSIFKNSGQNPALKEPLGPDGKVDKEAQIWFYRNEYWDNVDFTAEWLIRTPVFHNKLENYIKKYTPQGVDSLNLYADKVIEKCKVSPELFKHAINYIAVEYKKPPFMGANEVYAHVVTKYFDQNQTPWEKKEDLMRVRGDAKVILRSAIGAEAEDFTATDMNGNPIRLLDTDAKIIVLYMFSYSCENCKKETPEVIKLYNEWKSKGVDVYALCLDDDLTEWKKYVEKAGMPFRKAIDPEYKSGYHTKYHLDVTPELYVIGKDRKVIARDLKAFQLPPVFEEELGR